MTSTHQVKIIGEFRLAENPSKIKDSTSEPIHKGLSYDIWIDDKVKKAPYPRGCEETCPSGECPNICIDLGWQHAQNPCNIPPNWYDSDGNFHSLPDYGPPNSVPGDIAQAPEYGNWSYWLCGDITSTGNCSTFGTNWYSIPYICQNCPELVESLKEQHPTFPGSQNPYWEVEGFCDNYIPIPTGCTDPLAVNFDPFLEGVCQLQVHFSKQFFHQS